MQRNEGKCREMQRNAEKRRGMQRNAMRCREVKRTTEKIYATLSGWAPSPIPAQQ